MKNKNRVTWTEEKFRDAVKNSKSLSDVARTIGIKALGSNFKTIKKYIALWNLNTSHFGVDWKSITAKARSSMKIISNENLFVENSTIASKHIKSRYLQTRPVKTCDLCFIHMWHGQELILQLDHINGVNSDNRLENLRLLCPNCHSLTSTFCGKNRKDKREKKKYFCPDCNVEISCGANKCLACARKSSKNSICWPPKEEVIKLTEEHGFVGAGKILNCSDNAIRKHLKKIE